MKQKITLVCIRKFFLSLFLAVVFIRFWEQSLPIVPSSHAGGSARTTPSSSSLETEDFRQIEKAFSQDQFQNTQKKIAEFSRRYPRSTLLPTVENLHGLLLLKNHRPNEAIPHFQRAVDLSSESSMLHHYHLYNLSSAYLEANQIEGASLAASRIDIDVLDKTNKVKTYLLKSTIAEKKSQSIDAVRQVLIAGKHLSDLGSHEFKSATYRRLDHVMNAVPEPQKLLDLYQEFEDSPVSDGLLFHAATLEITSGNRGSAEVHLKTLMSRFGDSPYYAQAAQILTQSGSSSPVNSKAIGILLPLKGKFGRYGQKCLQGIQLAFGIFSSNLPDSKIQLIVEDSGDEPGQTIAAMDRLVEKHQVAAIIGPMITKGIDQILEHASKLGIPLISLARRSGTSQEYIFQGGLTQKLQAWAIAQYAIERLHARRFAIVYPEEKLGIDTAHSFWDAVETMGGKVVGFESYEPGETDFREVIDKLSGLYFSDARQRELDLLAREREDNNIKKRSRKTEQFFRLRPVVDYDAVFIADDAKVSSQILPTFAYRDVENISFLGTSTWNSPDFIPRAQNYAENATFVDALFLESSSENVQKFVDTFKATFGQEPSSMEALSYDAGLLLKNVLESSQYPLARIDVKERLKSIHEFNGVTGKITYKDGQFFRNLTVIKVKSGKFTEVKRSL